MKNKLSIAGTKAYNIIKYYLDKSFILMIIKQTK